MIEHISIRDFAIIKNAEIDFGPGLNVITGETGSGKSIVVEAMSLALGARADSSYVRKGAGKARIQLMADAGSEESSDGATIITREISSGGKNICRLDDEIVTLGKVQSIAKTIAEIHGQYDNQTLLDPQNHLSLVDAFGKERIEPHKEAFLSAYEKYKSVRRKTESLISEINESRRRKDLYRYEAEEIGSADPRPGEDAELTDRIELLKNGETVFRSGSSAISVLTDSDASAVSLVGSALGSLSPVSSHSAELSKIRSDLEEAFFTLQDASERLRAVLDSISFDPSEMDRAIARLDVIDNLKKKYGGTLEEVLARKDEALAKLDSIANFDAEKSVLDKELKAALLTLKEKTATLSSAREECASELGKAIEKELIDLNFKDAEIDIRLGRAEAISSTGGDSCEIYIKANPGEDLKPLAKTASGGEISRVMLAIRNVSADHDRTDTMIFDEIDTGISGVTASVVARKLREIASKHQIIAITHLPQIAAAADINFRIEKSSDDRSTYTSISRLSEDETVSEIARLIGGDNITDTTLASAAELIGSFRQPR